MSAPIPLKDLDPSQNVVASDYDALAYALEPSRRHLEDISHILRQIRENTQSLYRVVPIVETQTATAGGAVNGNGTPFYLSYRGHFNCMLFNPTASAQLYISAPNLPGFTRTLTNTGWYVINLPDGTAIYAASGQGPYTFHLRYDNIVWGTSL